MHEIDPTKRVISVERHGHGETEDVTTTYDDGTTDIRSSGPFQVDATGPSILQPASDGQ